MFFFFYNVFKMRAVANVLAPFLLVAIFLGVASKITPSREVSADGIDYSRQGKNASSKMNASMNGLSGKKVDLPMVGARLRPEDISASISDYSGLRGKSTANTSHKTIKTDALLNQEGVNRYSLNQVHSNTGTVSGKVLPPIIDPSTDFLSTSISVTRNPSLDIRGDPDIPFTSEPLITNVPTYGPYEPQMDNLRVGTYYPMKVSNAGVAKFFD